MSNWQENANYEGIMQKMIKKKLKCQSYKDFISYEKVCGSGHLLEKKMKRSRFENARQLMEIRSF